MAGPYGVPFWGIRPTGVPPSAGPGVHQLLPSPTQPPTPLPTTQNQLVSAIEQAICNANCIQEPMPHVYPNANTEIQQFSGNAVIWNGAANLLAASEMSRAELGVTPVTPPVSQPRNWIR